MYVYAIFEFSENDREEKLIRIARSRKLAEQKCLERINFVFPELAYSKGVEIIKVRLGSEDHFSLRTGRVVKYTTFWFIKPLLVETE